MLRYLRIEPVRRLDRAQSDVGPVSEADVYADLDPRVVLNAGFSDERRTSDKRMRCPWSLGYGRAIIQCFQL